jgi:hypothetical protein
MSEDSAVMGDLASLQAALVEANRDNAELRASLERERKKTHTLRGALQDERHRAGRLERQMAGVDDEAFDPTKQRGVGGIAVGAPSEFMQEVEQLEQLLGMAPTLDEQLRQLGTAAVERQLTAAVESDTDDLVARLVQIMWYARDVLREHKIPRQWDGVAALDAVLFVEDEAGKTTIWVDGPRTRRPGMPVELTVSRQAKGDPSPLVMEHLDLDGWQSRSDAMPLRR